MSQKQMSNEQNSKNDFEASGQEKPLSLLQEFVLFVRENKKWWLLPILFVLAFLGVIIILSSTGAAPFIYTLF
jgi:Family of unknown function (DUF5989)